MPKDNSGKSDAAKSRGKGKHKGGSKHTDTEPWCMEDLVFDSAGNLYIKNPLLADALQRAINAPGQFSIYCDDPNSPGSKINAMCVC